MAYRVTINGKTKPLSWWARKNGISRQTASKRVRDGWNLIDAVTTAVSKPLLRDENGWSRKWRRKNIDLNLVGKKIGNYKVVKYYGSKRFPSGEMLTYFLCKCKCGITRIVSRIGLVTRKATSCGCRGRKVARFVVDGQVKSPSMIAKEMGMRPVILYKRLQRGWSIERAISAPVRGK